VGMGCYGFVGELRGWFVVRLRVGLGGDRECCIGPFLYNLIMVFLKV